MMEKPWSVLCVAFCATVLAMRVIVAVLRDGLN